MEFFRWGLGFLAVAVTGGVLTFGVLGIGGADAAGPNGIFGNYEAILAQKLGITTSQLQSAEKAARDQTIDNAVGSGKMTQAQADKLKNGQGFPNGFGGRPGGHGPANGSGQGGPRSGAPNSVFNNNAIAGPLNDAITAAAQSLGVAPADLTNDLKSPQALASLAQSKNITTIVLKGDIMGAVQNEVQSAESSGKLSSDQGSTVINGLSQQLVRLINFGNHSGRGFGGPRTSFRPGAQQPQHS